MIYNDFKGLPHFDLSFCFLIFPSISSRRVCKRCAENSTYQKNSTTKLLHKLVATAVLGKNLRTLAIWAASKRSWYSFETLKQKNYLSYALKRIQTESKVLFEHIKEHCLQCSFFFNRIKDLMIEKLFTFLVISIFSSAFLLSATDFCMPNDLHQDGQNSSKLVLDDHCDNSHQNENCDDPSNCHDCSHHCHSLHLTLHLSSKSFNAVWNLKTVDSLNWNYKSNYNYSILNLPFRPPIANS